MLRELVPWRDGDRRVSSIARRSASLGNEQLLDIARQQPATRDALARDQGNAARHSRVSAATRCSTRCSAGSPCPEAELPRFPKAPRWDRDPDFDARVNALKTVRDAAATRLDLDPGVLCARDRLEAVARKNPTTLEELADVSRARALAARRAR